MIENPKHPYVQQLIGSIPVPDPTERWDTDITLPPEEELRGQVESGCRFYPRCPSRMDRCMTARPPLYRMDSQDNEVACYPYE